MAQTRYRDSQKSMVPGMDLFEDMGTKRTILNKHPKAKQIEEISVGAGPNNDADYTVKIDGVEITYTTDGTASQDELVQGLADAINGENLVNGTVEASADTGNDLVTVTARIEGNGFSISIVNDPSSDLSISQTQANATANPIPWGRLVEDHGNIQDKLGRLVDASNLTKRHLRLSVSSATNSTTYRVILQVLGETHEATFTSDGSATVDEVVNGLQSAIDGLSDLVAVTADTSNDNVEIKAETAGFVGFDVIDYNQTGDLTLSEQSDGDDITRRKAGVALVGGESTLDPSTDVGEYPGSTEVDIKEDGAQVAVEIEEQVARGNTVYVRLSANGSNDKLGAFRGSWDSGCVPLPDAKFVRAPDATVAAVEVP